jgi:hypothetical protein
MESKLRRWLYHEGRTWFENNWCHVLLSLPPTANCQRIPPRLEYKRHTVVKTYFSHKAHARLADMHTLSTLSLSGGVS